jgi:hypothetical protein
MQAIFTLMRWPVFAEAGLWPRKRATRAKIFAILALA